MALGPRGLAGPKRPYVKAYLKACENSGLEALTAQPGITRSQAAKVETQPSRNCASFFEALFSSLSCFSDLTSSKAAMASLMYTLAVVAEDQRPLAIVLAMELPALK